VKILLIGTLTFLGILPLVVAAAWAFRTHQLARRASGIFGLSFGVLFLYAGTVLWGPGIFFGTVTWPGILGVFLVPAGIAFLRLPRNAHARIGLGICLAVTTITIVAVLGETFLRSFSEAYGVIGFVLLFAPGLVASYLFFGCESEI
jgi:hypothetical protein